MLSAAPRADFFPDRRRGKGRHASGLNFGACFSYSLAERLKVPLLFVGNDFSGTDLEAALA